MPRSFTSTVASPPDAEEVSVMTTAVIGTGEIGSVVARELASGGETLRLSSAGNEAARMGRVEHFWQQRQLRLPTCERAQVSRQLRRKHQGFQAAG
jgi:hypothetical protein